MKITNTTSTTRKIYRFPIPHSRLPIPDSRFPIPDSRFPIMVVSLRKHLQFINS
ncbi:MULTISPECIES: hypothetical protein [unclassified Moorena]|uniref:hypothetical protein n=1 Tax=unclassified Moorena TaxID=2683338 RepID=UPI0014000985|nr:MULTISPECIES: hypothetical protein [unclassified Moorena]NEO14660.1 hypothetical protein [Moorena sp. SIO3E8]NEQ04188.1 hypothetical protein [Moorena sp. SIO3F7]